MTKKGKECFGALYYPTRVYQDLFLKNLNLLNAVGGAQNIKRERVGIKVICRDANAYFLLTKTMAPLREELNNEAVQRSLRIEIDAYKYRLFISDRLRNRLKKCKVKTSFVEDENASKAVLVFPNFDVLCRYMDTVIQVS